MSRPTSLVSGLLFVIVIFFTCCIQISLGALGDSCNTSPDSCTTSVTNSVCDTTTTKCRCEDDYYEDDGACELKKVLGVACDTTDECFDSNAVCSTICTCQNDYYKDTNNQCAQKKVLGVACDTTDECSDSNAVCSTICTCQNDYYKDTNNQCAQKKVLGVACDATDECSDSNAVCSTTCICKTDYYKDTTNQCVQMSIIKPVNINFSNTNRRNTTVTWTQQQAVSEITGYDVSWTPDPGVKTENSAARSSDIINLNPGKTYTVTVTTVITQNGITQKISNWRNVTTKQVLGGSCSTSTDCGNQYFAECFSTSGTCRCISGRYRNNDGNCHPVDELRPSSLAVSTFSSWNVEFTWQQSSVASQVTPASIVYTVTVTPGSHTQATSATSVTISGLTAGVSYSASIVASLNQDQKDETVSGNETPSFTTNKIQYNQTCRGQDVCSDNNAVCTLEQDTRCLCNAEYFWNGGYCFLGKALDQSCSDSSECGTANAECTSSLCKCQTGFYQINGECKGINKLRVTGLALKSSTNSSVTVQWREAADLAFVSKYDVIWTSNVGGSGSVPVSKGVTEKEIINLYSGTQYTMSVKTYISYRSQTITTPVIRVRTLCDVGSYGGSCEYRCIDRHCKNTSASCNNVDGSCGGQCQDGWMGVDCTGCHRSYGINCMFSCSDRHCKDDKAPCDHVTGFCSGPCTGGWQGDTCTNKCDNTSYGDNCAMVCADRHCRMKDTCHHEFGYCHGGCLPGWQGMSCMQGIQDFKDSMIAAFVVAGILFILLVTVIGILFWYVRSHQMKSESTDCEMIKLNNRQTNKEDGLYEIVDGQGTGRDDVANNADMSQDSSYINSPMSREQRNDQARHVGGFREGGYVNSGQVILMNEYESLDLSTTPQNAYNKLTDI